MHGIYVVGGGRNAEVYNNTIRSNSYGMELIDVESISVIGNTISHNIYGMIICSSANGFSPAHDAVLKENTLTANRYNFGILDLPRWGLDAFEHYIDASNTVNGKPVYYWVNKRDETIPDDAGYVALINCTHVTGQGLTLANNIQGILMAGTKNSTIFCSTISDNEYGIYFAEYPASNNNTIFCNNFINNTVQVAANQSQNNDWDRGGEGNYWSDHPGIDLDRDGIGDTQYVINDNNKDNYPLADPYDS